MPCGTSKTRIATASTTISAELVIDVGSLNRMPDTVAYRTFAVSPLDSRAVLTSAPLRTRSLR